MNRKPDRDREPTWWSDALLVWFAVVFLVLLILTAATCAAH